MDDEAGSRWMTYRELGAARGISPTSATRLAMRRKWRRQKGNDGITRVLVPPTEAAPTRATAPDVVGVIVGDVNHDVAPDITRTINALETALSSLREQLTAAEQRIAREAERADRAEIQVDREAGRADRAEFELGRERESARRLGEQIAALASDVARLSTPAGQSTPPGRWRRWLAELIGRG